MRSRLAKKVLKRPWRYSEGSWWAACRKLKALVPPSAAEVRGQWLKERWLELDAQIMKVVRARMVAWNELGLTLLQGAG